MKKTNHDNPMQNSFFNFTVVQNHTIRPFLKWAGGKGQLLEQIEYYLPPQLKNGEVENYFEPFVGGGAVFFFLMQKYKINKCYLYDINPELILAYSSIKIDVISLIDMLGELQNKYLASPEEERKKTFYKIREKFNSDLKDLDFNNYSSKWVERTAEIIFLNRTCFNGLFRVNSKGEFNVPFGKYENPRICDEDNLLGVARLLSNAEILKSDFSACEPVVNQKSFVYFDPPYRPLNATSSFTSYSSQVFGDAEQLRLSEFYRALHNKGAKLMLSNSDPKNQNPNDDFFERAYDGFRIERIYASRNINSISERRGKIKELLILNYL